MIRNDNREAVKILTLFIGQRAALALLRRYTLSDLIYLDRKSLMEVNHIGTRRADTILALPELLNQLANRPAKGLSVSCSKDVYDLYQLRFSTLTREQFMVLTLNTRNRILSENICALGSVNAVHVDPSEVVKQAVLRSAPSIICLHNHPSGDPTPSSEDRLLTERINSAASLLGVKMLDHVIVGPRSYYSFSDAGAL